MFRRKNSQQKPDFRENSRHMPDFCKNSCNDAPVEAGAEIEATANMKAGTPSDNAKVQGSNSRFVTSAENKTNANMNAEMPSDNAKGQKSRSRFMTGAALIAVASVVAKLLGALYRVPLTNILGAEGMGMYQLVFPVFALFMTLSTSGIPTALSRIVSEKRALGEPSRKYFAMAAIALIATGLVSGGILAGLAGKIAVWQGNGSTRAGYYIIAPTVLLVSVIAGFRGLFQGELDMVPTAVSNIIEQAVKLGAGIGLALLLKPRGVTAAVMGALLGVSASEVCALLYLFVTYLVKCARRERETLRFGLKEARGMFKMALPIAASAIILPLSSFFDSIILVNALKWGGVGQSVATAQYGLLSGPVNSLVNMPVVLIMSLAVVIVPTVSASRVTLDIDGVLVKSRLSIKLAYLIGVPCAAFFMVFAPRLLPTIYPALSAEQLALSVNLLRVTAANIVLLATMQIYVSLLQALDKSAYAAVALLTAIVLKAALSVVLTRYIGIIGGAIASLAMAATAFLGAYVAFRKICGVHLEKNVGLNLLLGVIMGVAGLGISGLVKNDLLATALGALTCAPIYVWLALLFGLVSREELGMLPMGKALKKLYGVVRFWEKDDET